MTNRTPRPLGRWIVAVPASLAAAVASLALARYLTNTPFVLLIVAVLATAAYAGIRPGLLATALSVVIVISTNMPAFPWGDDGGLLPGQVVALAIVGLASTLIAGLIRRNLAVRDAREAAFRRLNRELEARAQEVERAYEELRATEKVHERLVSILEATSDLVAIAEATGRRVYLNPAGRQLLGISVDADPASRLDSDRPQWAREQFANEILPAATRGGIWTGESAYRSTDGEEIPVLEVVIAHQGPDGRPEFFSTIARDIRGRKQREELLLRAQRLETAGRVAGQVAHDFNNLLAPLVGFPDLIKAELPEGHRAAAFCDVIQQAALRMAQINEDLLALGRRGHFEVEPISVNQLIEQALTQLGSLPGIVTMETRLDPDVLPVNGSAAQLARVVVNLVTNAREALSEGGKITISTRNVYLDQPASQQTAELPRGEYVVLDVTDTGPGIPPDLRERIFDPFFTTKQGATRRGAGLGLSVVQAVVQDHHGAVDVASAVGQGTTMSVYLPVTRLPVSDAVPEHIPGGDESVLIVDDDPLQRSVARELLESLGYSTHVVESGEQAVAAVADRAFDLVVLDMVMPPGIDGAETYRRILELRPATRAIIVSGYALSDRVAEAMELGAGEFLRKPVARKPLAVAVRAELDRARMPVFG